MTDLTIRLARPADAAALDDLARLDSARPLTGDVLVAEAAGRMLAAIAVGGGRAIADPFRPTAATVAVLRLRVEQLLAAHHAGRARTARRLRLRPAGST